MRNKSTQVALGGLSAALCITLMLSSAILPFSTYALPMFAGIVLIPLAVEIGLSSAVIAYTAVSFLSVMIVPDYETSLMFIAFFGYYPLLRMKMYKIKFFLVRIIAKFALFNLSMILVYYFLINLFGMVDLIDELSNGFGYLLLLMGNIGFILYDFALLNLMRLYIHKIRKHIFHNK